MSLAFKLAKPVLHAMDAETAHDLTLKALRNGFGTCCPNKKNNDPSLLQTIWGMDFANPVGLAAGFDKNAEVVGPMLRMGFGFVEVGTVTPKPQAGNPRPRVFRDPANDAVINRMGFPNKGSDVFRTNMELFLEKKTKPAGIVGINIGMNKETTEPARDYTYLVETLGPLADYLTVNISSPNTPGLRNLQSHEPLLDLLGQLFEVRAQKCKNNPPILVKFAPDLDEAQCQELAQTCLDAKVDGIIVTNTTLERPDYLAPDFATQKGGLSGKPLKDKATQTLSRFYKYTNGAIPLIGLGGIASAEDAYAKICAGASLVQVYTALVYHGPDLPIQIANGLASLLQHDGYTNISEAVGSKA